VTVALRLLLALAFLGAFDTSTVEVGLSGMRLVHRSRCARQHAALDMPTPRTFLPWLELVKIRKTLTRTILPVLLAICAVPQLHAQQSSMEAAAVKLGGAIVASKQKTVCVLDFSGPGDRVSTLGEKLADDLSAALAKSDGRLHMEDRTEIEKQRQEYGYPLDVVLDPRSAILFARDLGTKALVMGALSFNGSDRVRLTLNAYRLDGRPIEALEIFFPRNDKIAMLMTTDAQPYDLAAAFKSYPVAGRNGYSTPVCIQCPRPDFTPEAKAEGVHGVVELVAIVGKDGHLRNVTVVKRLSAGLTSQALNTVRTWKLKPSIGPDGQPAEVRQIIEAVFLQ
jgi:TonB family protein